MMVDLIANLGMLATLVCGAFLIVGLGLVCVLIMEHSGMQSVRGNQPELDRNWVWGEYTEE